MRRHPVRATGADIGSPNRISPPDFSRVSHRGRVLALTDMTRLSFAVLAVVACDHSGTVLQGTDGNPGSGSHEMGSDGTCSVAPWQYPDPDQLEPAWVTMSCPSGGCPGGTTCVYYQVDV